MAYLAEGPRGLTGTGGFCRKTQQDPPLRQFQKRQITRMQQLPCNVTDEING